MAPRLLSLAVLALLAIPTAFAQNVKVEKYKLPNGMTVILNEDHSVPVATVNIWYRVGSKDEADRRSGFAHLFEHLMFMGTQRVPNGDFDRIMEGDGGSNNASTAEDRTNYYSIGPSNLLPTLLWLDADRLEALGTNIDQSKLNLQRDVVKNERRQNTENTPYGKAYEAINALMFPKSHPYGHSVIGSMDDLSAATVDDVRNFFASYYVPNNASLVVAGDFDPVKIKPMIAQWFGTLPRRDDPPRPAVPAINFKGIKRVTMVDQVEQPKTIMVWHSPAAYKPGDAEMSLAASVLADGTASRLYQRLVVQQKLATDVSALQESRKLGSLFYIEATPADGVSLDKLESALDAAIRGFTKQGPSADELSRQSAKLERSILEGLQSLNAKADKLNEFEFYLGDPNSFGRVLDTYRNATPQSVQRQVAATLNLNNRLVLRVISQTTASQGPRDMRPPLDALKTFQPAVPTSFTLSNGIHVDYWSRPELPLTRLTALFGSGSDSDPANKAGLAAFTAEMADEGTKGKDSADFEEALSRIGAELQFSVQPTTVQASFTTLSKDFTAGASLFAEALREPRLANDDFARVKDSTLADLEQAQSEPRSIALRVGMRELFGSDHPSGRLATPDSVGKITLEDVRREHAAIFQPGNMRLYMAGSLKPEEAKAALERTLGNWQASAPKLSAPKYPAPANTKLRVFVVDRPNAPQTTIRFYTPGFPYRDPRRIPLEAAAIAFGGSFTSRLNQNLREKNGYTYGAGSSFIFQPETGLFSIRTDVRSDATGAAMKEILAELTKIRSGDVSVTEVTKAAATQRNDTIEPLSSLGGLLDEAAFLGTYGLGFSALGDELTAFQSLTPNVVNTAIKEGIAYDQGVIVLVGDKATILKQLEGLGLPMPEVTK